MFYTIFMIMSRLKYFKNLVFLTFAFLLTGCITPVNLQYETAKILDKGEVSFTGSVSQQGNGAFGQDDENWNADELSFGARLTMGLGNRFNLSLRYENSLNDFFLGYRQHFIESQIKWAIGKNYFDENDRVKYAIGLPFQFYFLENNYSVYGLSPRLFMTFFNSLPNFRMTVIPKINVLYDIQLELVSSGLILFPSISVNFSLSNNIDKWSLMPEIGIINKNSISFGLGFAYKI